MFKPKYNDLLPLNVKVYLIYVLYCILKYVLKKNKRGAKVSTLQRTLSQIIYIYIYIYILNFSVELMCSTTALLLKHVTLFNINFTAIKVQMKY